MNNTQRLFQVATLLLPLTATPVYAALDGALYRGNCNVITGWAWDSAQPTARIKLDIYDVTPSKTTRLTTLTAQQFRPDLLNAGKGDGKHGFTYVLPASIRNAMKHQFSVRYQGTNTEVGNSPKATLGACYGKLNDTGIKTCSDDSTDRLGCPVTGYEGQDGDYGRDALARAGKLRKTGGGKAGFDFTKIANDGSVLPKTAKLGNQPKDWACTRDNVTGLLWEVKTADSGLRDKDNSYSWYNPDNKTNGGSAGYPNRGTCYGGISCDTDGYVKAVNALKLCGKSAWRAPKQAELLSIADYGNYKPAIDTAYFPNTAVRGYWSSSPVAYDKGYAWIVDFGYGYDYWYYKRYNHVVRLVHSGQ